MLPPSRANSFVQRDSILAFEFKSRTSENRTLPNGKNLLGSFLNIQVPSSAYQDAADFALLFNYDMLTEEH
uniref:Uncharacterized protein n=1 Tax=Trichuris muris TaxID=70415 RepID=A0A5S6QZN7_TRIMR